jgi:hypothetical protein
MCGTTIKGTTRCVTTVENYNFIFLKNHKRRIKN